MATLVSLVHCTSREKNFLTVVRIECLQGLVVLNFWSWFLSYGYVGAAILPPLGKALFVKEVDEFVSFVVSFPGANMVHYFLQCRMWVAGVS